MEEEQELPPSFVPDSFVPDHTESHPQSGLSPATHSFLENHPVLNWLVKGGPIPQYQPEGYTGNIDLHKQPVVKNPSGGESTVYSRSYNIDGKETLLPSVTPDGRFLQSDEDVLNEYKKTGRHLGKFNSVDEANKFAEQLHKDYERGMFKPIVGPGLTKIPGVEAAGDWANDKLTATGNYYAGALGGGLKYLSEILATGADPRMAIVPANKTVGRLGRLIESDRAAGVGSEQAKMLMKPRLAAEIVNPEIVKTGEVSPPQPIRTGFSDRKYKANESKPFDPATSFNNPVKEEIPPANVNPQTGEELPVEIPAHQAVAGTEKAVEQQSKARQAYEAARSLMSVDLPYTTSAAFRQASPFIGTKRWFQAWEKSAKSYGNQEFYDGLMQSIQDRPLVKSGYADEIGVRFTNLGDLSKREESIRSSLVERLPWVKASNRSYTAFLNYIRAETLDDLVGTAKSNGLDPERNLVLGKQIADFINDATGRGSLKFMAGKKTLNIENSAKLLTDTMFSPRLMASRINMLNPSNYMFTEPMIRQQYLKGMLRSIGSWWGIASAVELAGLGDVNKDPNSADFGKIRIGDTRIDPGAGFQQYLVLGHRMLPEALGGGGITSSTTGAYKGFGQGYKPETRLSTLAEFGMNKLHPVIRFAADFLRANPNRQFNVGDRTAQMVLPIIAGDMIQLIKQDPSLLPLIVGGSLAGTSGMGVQSYSRGKQQPTYVPENYDFVVK